MTKAWSGIVLGVFLATPVLAGLPEQRLNRNGVALCDDRDSKNDEDCYDPVAYLENGKAEKAGAEGAKKFRVTRDGVTYVFSSQDHLSRFQKNPEKYLPQFGGWCAYAVAAKKEKVDIDPKSFLIQDGRLLLFFNGLFADTKKTWQTDKTKPAKSYLEEADKNWPTVKTKEE